MLSDKLKNWNRNGNRNGNGTVDKHSFEYLRKRYMKCCIVEARTDKFAEEQRWLERELAQKQFSVIYRELTRSWNRLRMPRGFTNYFAYCSHFARETVDRECFPSDEFIEIGSHYMESHCPLVIDFD
jgi:hypothetical protein